MRFADVLESNARSRDDDLRWLVGNWIGRRAFVYWRDHSATFAPCQNLWDIAQIMRHRTIAVYNAFFAKFAVIVIGIENKLAGVVVGGRYRCSRV